MNRRGFLECAALLVGGVTASQASFSLTDEQKVYLATASDYVASEVDFFTSDQRELITHFSEIIIPETQTPGAKQAGTSRFIELMVADWLNDQEREIFMSGLESIPSIAFNSYSKRVGDLSEIEMLGILETLEEDASDDPWYAFANTTGAFGEDHKSPFICQLKELTIWGFFTSEVGAKQVLRYSPMPMSFKGDIPLKEDDSAWAGRNS